MVSDPASIVHFIFSPVQSFVAQARRARDLWASSYLISYLAGAAMKAIGPGRIVFPNVENDEMMRAIEGKWDRNKPDFQPFQRIGSLPNRFTAQTDAVGAKQAAKALRETWKKIAQTVWDKKIEAQAAPDSRCIWNRQIESFWDITWVIGDHRNVDLRKNLRNWLPPSEHGEKCSMCGERQEISGMGMGSFESRGKMREWWTDLAKKINGKTGLHLRMDENDQCDERLCAVCLTKRLFPLVAEQAIGWKMPINFPSVSYMASVEWLKTCFDRAPVEAARFAETAGGVGIDKSETKTRLQGLSGKLKKRIDQIKGVAGRQGWLSDWHDFVDLDGSACFKDAIRSKDFRLNETEQKELIGALEKLQQAAGASASPFYALLGMDGDSMGALLSNCTDKERQAVSEGIMTFSRKVPGIVDEHDGWLIYAGGEDVLAFLPLDSALACTVDLRQCYRGTFTDPRLSIRAFQRDAATISAAINFVHIHTSLQVAVRDTQKLLEEYAKEHMGRDALACRVWKRGGPILTWAIPWEHALAIQIEPKWDCGDKVKILVDEIKWRFQDNTDDPSQFSNKFFYKLEDLFELLPSLDDQQMVDLLTAEYLANREMAWPDKDISEAKKREEARKRIARLFALCEEKRRKAERNAQGELAVSYGSGGFHADGALLVRFLVQKGLEK